MLVEVALLVVLKYYVTQPNTLYPIIPYGFISKGEFPIWIAFLIQLTNMHCNLCIYIDYIVIVQSLYQQSLTFIVSCVFVTFPPKVNIYLHNDLNLCFILFTGISNILMCTALISFVVFYTTFIYYLPTFMTSQCLLPFPHSWWVWTPFPDW